MHVNDATARKPAHPPARQTTRDQVKPGQRFRFTENPTHGFPCVALEAEVDRMIHDAYRGVDKRLGHPWHVYTLTGRLSWSFYDSVVYVPIDTD